jgi:hypothetical protein
MQMVGAYGVFFIFLIWLARYHLWDVSRQAFGRAPLEPAHAAWFSNRLAAWGLIGGTLVLVIWLNLLGIRLWVSGLVIGSFLMISLVASRIITQGGLAYFTLTAAPLDGLTTLFGPGIFSAAGMFIAAVVQKALFLDLRESLMPSLVHASRITEETKHRRLMITAITAALVIGVIVSFTAMLALCYRYGIRELGLDWASGTTLHTYENIITMIETPPETSHWVRIFAIIGAAVMLLLVVGYHRFYWWPLHPIGYLMCYSSAMRILWFNFFIGWLCNALCMRYGGVELFKKIRLLFIGLIIGDFLMGGTWALVGLFTDASYQVLPS